MKVVLDTNVLVSGLLAPFGPPGEMVRMVSSGSLQICFDARILSEYEEVLRRPKFGFSPDETRLLLNQIQGDGFVVAADPLPHRLPDPWDEPFVEVAWAGKAEALITGNIRHFPRSACGGVFVVSPADFLDFYRKNKK
jgi:putative PIN family toxin of toxin-antitoxin system